MSKYDAFISYSHEADGKLAPAIRDGLQQLAKPWNKRRAINVFLDQSSLEVSAGLKDSLHAKLEGTNWLVLLLSTKSAGSDWVGEEIANWAATKPAGTILLVHTEGELIWGDGDWDWDESTAAPRALAGVYEEEPLWLDLREYREQPDLHIRTNTHFKEDLATLAAPIHGKSKEELVGEDLVQFRRARRLRRLAIAGLATLTLAATILGTLAFFAQRRAEHEARLAESRAMAGQALNNALTDRDLAALLALESLRVADTSEARGSLLGILGLPSRFQERTNAHPERPVTAAAFDDTGRLAATADVDGTIVMWDVDPDNPLNPATARETRFTMSSGCLGGAEIDLNCIIGELRFFQEDGISILAAVAGDGAVAAWDVATGEVLPLLGAQGFPAAAVSSDFGLYAGHTEDTMELYDIDGKFIDNAFLAGALETTEVGAAAFSPDESRRLAWTELIADEEGELRVELMIWDWRSDSSPLPIAENPFISAVTSLAFSPDGSLLLAGEGDGGIWIFDAASLTVAGELEPRPASPPRSLAFDPGAASDGGFTLASAHSNGEVWLWGVFEDGGVLLDRLLGHNEAIDALAFGPAGQIVSGSFAGEVIWWSEVPQFVFGDRLPVAGDTHGVDVQQVAFLDNDTVASIDAAGFLIETDRVSGFGAFVEDIEPGDVTGFDAAAETLALGFSIEGSAVVALVNMTTDAEEPRILDFVHDETIRLVELSDDGHGLITSTDDRSLTTGSSVPIAIWDAASGELFPAPQLPADFEIWTALHPGRPQEGEPEVVWLGGRNSTGAAALKVDARTGEVMGQPLQHGIRPLEGVMSIAASADGTLLVTGGSDRKIHAWDPERLEREEGSFEGHNEEVTGLAFIDGDARLISTDQDLVVNYWDVTDRRLITSFGGPADGINDLALSPDRMTVAVASEDDFVHTWTLDADEWINRACLLAGRNMTEQEWALYGRGSYVRHCDFPGTGELAEYALGDLRLSPVAFPPPPTADTVAAELAPTTVAPPTLATTTSATSTSTTSTTTSTTIGAGTPSSTAAPATTLRTTSPPTTAPPTTSPPTTAPPTTSPPTTTSTPLVTLDVALMGSGEGLVTVQPPGTNCTSECLFQYPAGTEVTLTATTFVGSLFASFQGAGCPIGPSACVVTMSDDAVVVPVFQLGDPVNVSLDITPPGAGTVVSDPPGLDCDVFCSFAYPTQTLLTLTALAGPDVSFTGWSGAPGCSGGATCAVTLVTALDVLANFAPVAPAAPTAGKAWSLS